MVSAVRIVPVLLHFLSWNWNVLPVFSAFCVDVADNVLDFGRVAVRVIATAHGRIIRHVPLRIKLFVQELILWRMVVKRSVALSIFLCLGRHRQRATKTAP